MDVLIFDVGFGHPWPEGRLGIFLLKDEHKVEAGLGPFGFFCVDGFEEFEFEGILFVSTGSLELEVGAGEFNFFIGDVHEGDFQEDTVLALSPFDQRMQPESMAYLHSCVEASYYY